MTDPADDAATQAAIATAPAAVAAAVADGTHLIRQMNMRDVESTPKRLVVEMDLTGAVSNTRGDLNGGIAAVMVDVVAGRLSARQLPKESSPRGSGVATTDMNIRYLAPVAVGPARAEGTVIRAGRTMIVLQVDITDVGTGKLAATATVAFAVLSTPRNSAPKDAT